MKREFLSVSDLPMLGVLSYIPPRVPPAHLTHWPEEWDAPGVELRVLLASAGGSDHCWLRADLVSDAPLLGFPMLEGWGSPGHAPYEPAYDVLLPPGLQPPRVWFREQVFRQSSIFASLFEIEAELREIWDEAVSDMRRALRARRKRVEQRRRTIEYVCRRTGTITP